MLSHIFLISLPDGGALGLSLHRLPADVSSVMADAITSWATQGAKELGMNRRIPQKGEVNFTEFFHSLARICLFSSKA